MQKNVSYTFAWRDVEHNNFFCLIEPVCFLSSRTNGDGDADASSSDDDDDLDDGSGSSSWPWESCRNKLRDALTELSVLSDVITVATKDCGKDPASGQPKRYMVLDGPVQHEQPDARDEGGGSHWADKVKSSCCVIVLYKLFQSPHFPVLWFRDKMVI